MHEAQMNLYKERQRNGGMMERNLLLARKCLQLIRDIADRGASSGDDGQVVYALQELSQVLFERAGHDARVFEVESVADLGDLSHLYEDLLFVDGASHDMLRPN
jgi:hypothetical protein